LPASAGFEPSVVYQVSAAPEPASVALRVTATSAFCHVAGTSSAVLGAVVSTFAAAEVFADSRLPTSSTDA
jgi:hypothetical protein